MPKKFSYDELFTFSEEMFKKMGCNDEDAVVDGDGGLGLVVAPRACELWSLGSAISRIVPMPDNMPGEGVGHFFGAMRIDAFRPAEEFKRNMDQWITRFRKAKTVENEQKVLIPGDQEREMQEIRKKEGIPLLQPVIDDLEKLAIKYQLNFSLRRQHNVSK